MSLTPPRPNGHQLVHAMQSDVSSASSGQDIGRKLEELERELGEAHRREAATAEVLRVIRNSPTDLQLVFDTIVSGAVRLLRAYSGVVTRVVGDQIELVAHTSVAGDVSLTTIFPQLITSETPHARAIRDRMPINIFDTQTDQGVPEAIRTSARARGYRSWITVPLLRDEKTIGTLAVTRREPGGFNSVEISLLQTFADQAVIAIENTRLFEAVQEKNHALTDAHAQVSGALERETATSEILRVIGSSPTDVQPIFETIARSGVSVCGALGCVVLVVDGGMIHVAATHGVRPERLERFRQEYPIPLSAEIDTAETIRHRRMFHMTDIENNPNATAAQIENARLAGYRTRLMIPMVRGDRTLGLIAVTREDPTPFPDQIVELFKTFADQAVIAIENTRLFEAEQASKRELRESLEYQTAISDVLSVISRSPSNLQPVLEAIVQTAVRLCHADFADFRLLRDGASCPYPNAACAINPLLQAEALSRVARRSSDARCMFQISWPMSNMLTTLVRTPRQCALF